MHHQPLRRVLYAALPLLLLLLNVQSALSLWDFGVTVRSKVIFYDQHWQEVTSSAHQFDHLSAITFDEAEEIIYFNDQLHNNASIFSLKIPIDQENPHIIKSMVQRMNNETVTSIAYDPLNRNLYWSDRQNRKIYFIAIDNADKAQPSVLIDFATEETRPDGLAIDICRRKLYWTNSNFKNATVERIDLDGTQREIIVQSELYLPHGIVVDQLSDRIYWVVDQQGDHFSVESANLDGSDRRVIVKGLNNRPLNLAVTKNAIFWTDLTHDSIWSYSKFPKDPQQTELTPAESMQPRKLVTFSEEVRGIIARTRFLTNLQNDQHCADVVNKIKSRLLKPKPTLEPGNALLSKLRREYCLNGGEYTELSDVCICKIGYSGARCETKECHNYCVHGTCTTSSMGFPECHCQHGFYGERCQSYKCTGHCHNEGSCEIDSNGDATCICKDNFGGQRCEHNSTEICTLFCRIQKYEPNTPLPYGCHDVCESLSEESEDGAGALPTYKHLETCKTTVTLNSTVIAILVCGVIVCLCLVLLIIHTLRRFYKPARPRIKKTFVVRKHTTSSADTPLTNRPIATEQCEITIENCCNMNICDTPCFDPKLVQQSMSRDANVKEDKKMLIHNLEDELY